MVCIKLAQENIFFHKNDDESYDKVDLFLNKRFFGYKDAYNYYDIDVDNILLFKKRDGKYFIRYNGVNKMNVVPLQLKIKNFYREILTYADNNRVMYIHNGDKELFKKCREIWNKITELIDINNAPDFVETILDDGDEFFMVDVHKNTSFIEGNYRNKLIMFLHFVFNDCLQTSLVQGRY